MKYIKDILSNEKEIVYYFYHRPQLRHNKFIFAIDGSATPLPNLPGLRDEFGRTGAKVSSPTARMSIAYDVTNDFIMDDDFSPLTVSERTHAKNHLEKVGNLIDLKEAIFIMDRGYANEKLIRLFSEKSNYLFRIRNKFNVGSSYSTR